MFHVAYMSVLVVGKELYIEESCILKTCSLQLCTKIIKSIMYRLVLLAENISCLQFSFGIKTLYIYIYIVVIISEIELKTHATTNIYNFVFPLHLKYNKYVN